MVNVGSLKILENLSLEKRKRKQNCPSAQLSYVTALKCRILIPCKLNKSFFFKFDSINKMEAK